MPGCCRWAAGPGPAAAGPGPAAARPRFSLVVLHDGEAALNDRVSDPFLPIIGALNSYLHAYHMYRAEALRVTGTAAGRGRAYFRAEPRRPIGGRLDSDSATP